ncbi:MAG: carboxypeptidase regulatory-like domain-containing protein [Terracidiphilus sp.]
MKSRYLLYVCFYSLAALSIPSSLFAQSESGSITGTITDPSGAVVQGAEVTVTDLGTNTARISKTGANGEYSFSTLRPSHYKITVNAPGFKESLIADIELHTQDKLSENLALSMGSSGETVNVSAETEELETSAAVTTTVDRHFIENMPLSGRSFQALIALTPGNVTAKTYYTNSGQFSIDGQRTDANYFSIDGVSANVGITQGSNVYLGSAGAGAAQATSNNGGYNNLVSIDDMQEYKIQTNSFDAEYGRTPGAQLSIVTRSGTNQFHGTAFEYLRNDVFDANTWFNNNEGLPRLAEKQNDFGGVVGGPILRDKLFFFASYEGLRLRVPESKINVVPTTFARNQASAAVLPLLEAYPLPSAGQDLPGEYTGQFFAGFSNPSTLNATSVRLDYSPTPKLTLFIRGDDAPSFGEQHGAFDYYATSSLSSTTADVDTTTAGATYILTPTMVNEFRFNISHSKGATTVVPIAFGGATIPSSSYLFQSDPNYNIGTSVFAFFFNDSTTDYYVGNDATNHQRQLNYVDTLGWTKGRHTLKFGADIRHLTPTNGYRPWDISYDFDSVQELVTTQIPANGYAGVDTYDTSELKPIFNDVSFFAQDSWQVKPRLTLNYGLRWDYDPPPSEGTGHPFYTVTGLDDIATVTIAPKGTPLWSASKHNFAPRLGIAYVLNQTPGSETVLRGGGGVFYGLGDQQGAQGTLGFPYGRSEYLYGAAGAYPLSQATAAPIPFTLNPPYSFVFAFDPNLRDPRVYMWNASLQQSMGNSRSLQMTYVGNHGSDLLRNEMLTPAMGASANFGYLDVVTNNDYSNYDALEVQFKQSPWHSLQFLATYTWSHGLDNGSSVALPIPYHTIYSPSLDYGDSDYDIHNTFTTAITYEVPKIKADNSALSYVANGWAFDNLFRSNSAAPITITTGVFSYGLVWNETAANQRPNVVPNVPFYLNEPSAPGGKVINAAAFTVPSNSFSQGDMGRNVIRGFNVWQEDIALRREFPIHESLSFLFRAEAFNVFNHPLFGDVGVNDGRNILSSYGAVNPYFGISSEDLASSLGGGGADGGYSSLYQIGAPRSLQFALKLRF